MNIKVNLFTILMLATFSIFAQAERKTVLNITPGDIANFKEKIATDDWIKARWIKIQSIANETTADYSPIELPVKGGNWPHFYVDPDEGKPLVPGKYLGNWHWEHHNQAGTKTYLGTDSIQNKDYDGVLILEKVHSVWADKLFALALAYRIDGNPKYLKKAIEILESYNRTYTKIAPHDKAGGNNYDYGTGVGRVGAQALDESVWLTRMLQGISLVWDGMTALQQEECKSKFLYPAVEMIQKCHNLEIQNISNWYNAAVGMTGYLTANESMIYWSLLEKGRGLKYQLAEGFTPDGDWYENAPSYHFYALNPIILLAESAKNNGNSAYIGAIKKCLDGPLQLMMPNLRIPMFNDSKAVYLPGFAGFYEYGYTRFKSEAYLPVLHRARLEREKRQSADFNLFDYSLLYSAPIPQSIPAPEFKSLHLPGTGFDVLYSGKGEESIWLACKYDLNSHAGWHMHPDALDFVLYAKGEEISMDPGTTDYGAPSHNGWDKTTIAHNALVINQKNQNFRMGRSVAFGETKGVSWSFCATDSAYKCVTHIRAFLIADANTVLVADWVNADSACVMDIAYHQRGTWKMKDRGVPMQFPDVQGYKFLKEVEISAPDSIHSFSTVIHGKEVAVQLMTSQPVRLITATGLGYNFESTPCAVSRYVGKNLFALWAIRLDGRKDPLHFEFYGNEKNQAVSIQLSGKKITLDPEGKCQVIPSK